MGTGTWILVLYLVRAGQNKERIGGLMLEQVWWVLAIVVYGANLGQGNWRPVKYL